MEQSYVALTTHPTKQSAEVKVNWGARTPEERRPVIGVEQSKVPRNAIGAHGGSYMVYKALAVANGSLDPTYKPDLHNTQPSFDIPPMKVGMVRIRIKAFVPWIRGVTK